MDRRLVATRLGDLGGVELHTFEAPEPQRGEVTIEVRASGVNPVDAKMLDRISIDQLPYPLGFECAGVITAIGPDTKIASGRAAVGDEVLAFRVPGAHASRVTVSAGDVFAKPAALSMDEAAGLLLAGTTAAEMLWRVGAVRGDTVLLHGASGAVGVSVLQQAAHLGVRVIGTCSERGAADVKRFGGIPTPYGEGLADRVRALAPEGIAAALDAAGTDEAIEVSLELVSDRSSVLTIVRHDAAKAHGIRSIGGANPESAAFRDEARAELIALAAAGDLVVPIARSFPLGEARAALDLVAQGKAGGKVVLHP